MRMQEAELPAEVSVCIRMHAFVCINSFRKSDETPGMQLRCSHTDLDAENWRSHRMVCKRFFRAGKREATFSKVEIPLH